MARSLLDRLVSYLAFYSYGLLCWLLYLFQALRSGEFFRNFTEKDLLQYEIGEQDQTGLRKKHAKPHQFDTSTGT